MPVQEKRRTCSQCCISCAGMDPASCGCQWTPIGIWDPSGTESEKAKVAKYRNELGSDLESGFGFRNPKMAQKKEKRKFIKI